MMRRGFTILLALVLPLLVSCEREQERGGGSSPERGSLTLFLGTGSPDTRTATAENLKEGNLFDDLLVVITNDGDLVVDHIFKHNITPQSSYTVDFEDLPVGSYHVYAYANVYNTFVAEGSEANEPNTDWQVDGMSISEVEALLDEDVHTHDDAGEDKNRLLEHIDLVDTSTPYAPGPVTRKMLLTGHRELQVGAQDNVGEVELLRPVARLNVLVYNDTAYEVTIDDLWFHDINPTDSYVLAHWDENGIPAVPPGTVFGPMNPYDKAHPQIVHPHASGSGDEDHDGHRLVYSTFMYEGASTNTYRMFAKIGLNHIIKDADGNVTGSEYLTKELFESGLHLLTYNELEKMPVDTKCQVLMVSPNSATGAFVGFDGSSKSYYNARHGHEEWYWRDAKRTILTDDGLKNKYLLTLEKTGPRQFKIYKGTNQMFAAVNGSHTSETVTISEGHLGDAGWPLANGYEGYLVRFESDCEGWDNTYFRLEDGNAHFWNGGANPTEGYYMWALYGVDLPGSPLEVIDHDTEQISRLTCIRRGMEINIKINVYYGEDDYHINFDVENTYWTTGGHEMSHTFN